MNQERNADRRFVAIMLVLLAPLAVGLLFVTSMQRSGVPEICHSSDFSIVGLRHNLSYWGGEYRSVFRLWNVETGDQTGHWSTPRGSMTGLMFSNSGDRFLFFDSNPTQVTENRVVIGSNSEGPKKSLKTIKLPGAAGVRNLRWTEGGSKLIYTDQMDQIWRYDIQSGRYETLQWDRPANSDWQYWASDRNLVSVSDSRKPTSQRSYQLIGNKLVAIGPDVTEGPSGVWAGFLADGTRMINVRDQDKQCDVIDVASGELITTIRSDGRSVAYWSCDDDRVVCYYGNVVDVVSRKKEVFAAQIFDAESGEMLHETTFAGLPNGVRYIPQARRYVWLPSNDQIASFDLNGNVFTIAPSLLRFWWPARILFILLAGFWWLTWSLKLRRDHRSLQPCVDIAILHAIVFVCSCVRLWAYVYGPDWSGYLHVWESVPFIGTSLSMITWFLLWIMFGPQRWSMRVGAFVFGAAVVVGAIVLVWDTGSDAGGYDAALAIAQTLIGLFTQVTVQLGILWLAYLVGVRLCHFSDPPETNEGSANRRMSIRDVAFWMIAFGVLFSIIRLRTIEIPNADNLAQLAMSGCVGAMIGVVTLWLGLGSRLWRIPFVFAGYSFGWWYFHNIGRLEVMHVGAAWIPMLLVSAMVMRWNGYRLRRPSDSRSPQAAGLEFVGS